MNHSKGQTGSTKSKTPERLCMTCRSKAGKKTLLRIVRTPSGEVVLDLTGKQNGRGAYVCRSEECITKVRKSVALSKALKVQVPEELFETMLTLKEE